VSGVVETEEDGPRPIIYGVATLVSTFMEGIVLDGREGYG
jgi:hypothetical protein